MRKPERPESDVGVTRGEHGGYVEETMKLLKIEFENINSYRGRWSIDFTDKEYGINDNQFVISGPTASGKTTILDVITLALYGKTPRQPNMTAGNNEVMNKESGNCMASVTYACDKGVIRSTFRQNRARNKVDGNLQNPQIRIEYADTNEVVKIGGETCEGSTVERLAKGTEALIHLSYDQFVRSIMIPQGEFSKFLRSDAREKAAILARVSGTGYYKQIGAEVWATANAFLEDYEARRKLRDTIVVLSEEDVAKLREEKEAAEREAKKEQKKAGEIQDQITLKKQWDSAVEDLRKAETELQQAADAGREFASDRAVLERAQKALNCQASFSVLKSAREGLKTEQQRKKEAEAAVEEMQKRYDEASAEEEKCKADVAELESEEPAKRELWNRVRELDARLSPEKKSYEEKEDKYQKAQKEYGSQKARADELDREISELETLIGEYKRYLEENEKDGKLSELCVELDGNRKALEQAAGDYETAKADKAKYEKQYADETDRYEKFCRERDRFNEELLSIVEQKHVVIAGILRSKLVEGKACPVCGSEYHASCVSPKNVPEANADSETGQEETAAVAANVAELSNKLEEAGKNAADSEKNAGTLKNRALDADERMQKEQGRQKDILDEVDKSIRPWNEQVNLECSDTVGQLQEVIKRLGRRAQEFKRQSESLNGKQQEQVRKKAARDGIDLEKLRNDADRAKEDFSEAEKRYSGLLQERKDLFGERNVAEEEQNFRGKMQKKHDDWETVKKQKQNAETQKKVKEGERNSAIKAIGEREKEIVDRKKVFDAILMQNGFSSEEEFSDSVKTQEEIEELDSRKNKLDRERTAAEITLKNKLDAKNALGEKCPVDRSAEDLEEEREQCEKRQTEALGKSLEIQQKIDADNAARESRKEQDAELERLAKKWEICKNLKDMIGVKDGSDFEVFVQNIAMKNLVIKANEYMAMLEPDQQLVLNKEKSMDILVQEGEIVRPISNTSGGETFCISLSLALAMAEFTGKNGIEALFLDEGFGTLSGDPLRNSITSLKRLGNTGKLLGIITHVNGVIEEFDLRLAASKSGKVSKLTGPGVTGILPESGRKKG